MYATITHHDDGDLPQQILAVTPDEAKLAPSLLSDLIDGRIGSSPALFGTPVQTPKEEEEVPASQRKLLEQLLQLLAPTTTPTPDPNVPTFADMGMNTGGLKETGQRLPAKRGLPRQPKPLDTATIIQRIRVSYPALRAARVDSALRQLFLAELITQVHNEGGSVVLPQGTRC